METCKRILKGAFCLSPRGTVAAAALGFSFVIAVAASGAQNLFVRCASYLASAYALVVTVTGFRHLPAAVDAARARVLGHPLMRRFRATAFGKQYMTDVRFRARLSLYQGLFINLLYIGMKLASGILYHSAWFIALAIYYALLAVMRVLLLGRMDARDTASELRRYRLCGVVLLIMSQALAAMVIFIVHQNRGFDYPGLLIYGMAAYAFYAVISAAVNVVRTRRHNSPILSAAKAISLVAAMVSILSLETALIARFGDDAAFRRLMTGVTGGGVCILVIGMAVFMIRKANRGLRMYASH